MTVTWGRLMLKPRCCMTIPEGPGNERTHVEEVRAHHPNVLILFEHLTKVEPEHESVAQSWVKLLRDGWTLDVPTRTLHPPPNPPQPVKCSCGYIATKGFQFCPKCGLQLDAEAEPVEPAPEPVVIPDTPTKAPKAPKAPKLKKKKEA
jgi:outer membrane biosynthesis protein TonB